MPINPKYAQAIENAKKSGGKEFEKLPAIWLNNVGDGFRGTVIRVSDMKTVANSHPKAPAGSTKDIQFVDLKDVTVRRLDGEKGEFVEETLEKATFCMDKGGHFEAVFAALMELNASVEGEGFDDIPLGGMFGLRRGANDDKRHTFKAKIESPIPF